MTLAKFQLINIQILQEMNFGSHQQPLGDTTVIKLLHNLKFIENQTFKITNMADVIAEVVIAKPLH